jgi:hypothetical protein
LAAERAVPGRHVERDNVRELGQVGFAENDSARGAQPRDDRCVAGSVRLGQRQRSGGRMNSVASRDIVLDENRDPGERPALARLRAVA